MITRYRNGKFHAMRPPADVHGIGFSDEEIEERTSRAGVFIQFAENFIRDGENFARINLGCPRSAEEKGLQRLKKALT